MQQAAARPSFAPFEKGVYGGFAFDLRERAQRQRQIPLCPPFSKGEEKRRPCPKSKDGVREKRSSASALRAYAQGERCLKAHAIAEAVRGAAPRAAPRLEAAA